MIKNKNTFILVIDYNFNLLAIVFDLLEI